MATAHSNDLRPELHRADIGDGLASVHSTHQNPLAVAPKEQIPTHCNSAASFCKDCATQLENLPPSITSRTLLEKNLEGIRKELNLLTEQNAALASAADLPPESIEALRSSANALVDLSAELKKTTPQLLSQVLEREGVSEVLEMSLSRFGENLKRSGCADAAAKILIERITPSIEQALKPVRDNPLTGRSDTKAWDTILRDIDAAEQFRVSYKGADPSQSIAISPTVANNLRELIHDIRHGEETLFSRGRTEAWLNGAPIKAVMHLDRLGRGTISFVNIADSETLVTFDTTSKELSHAERIDRIERLKALLAGYERSNQGGKWCGAAAQAAKALLEDMADAPKLGQGPVRPRSLPGAVEISHTGTASPDPALAVINGIDAFRLSAPGQQGGHLHVDIRLEGERYRVSLAQEESGKSASILGKERALVTVEGDVSALGGRDSREKHFGVLAQALAHCTSGREITTRESLRALMALPGAAVASMSGVTLDMERRIVVIPGALLTDVTVAAGKSITLGASESGVASQPIKIVSMHAGKTSSINLSVGRFELASSSFAGTLAVNPHTKLQSCAANELVLPTVSSTGKIGVFVDGCRITHPPFGLGKLFGATPSLVRS